MARAFVASKLRSLRGRRLLLSPSSSALPSASRPPPLTGGSGGGGGGGGLCRWIGEAAGRAAQLVADLAGRARPADRLAAAARAELRRAAGMAGLAEWDMAMGRHSLPPPPLPHHHHPYPYKVKIMKGLKGLNDVND